MLVLCQKVLQNCNNKSVYNKKLMFLQNKKKVTDVVIAYRNFLIFDKFISHFIYNTVLYTKIDFLLKNTILIIMYVHVCVCVCFFLDFILVMKLYYFSINMYYSNYICFIIQYCFLRNICPFFK